MKLEKMLENDQIYIENKTGWFVRRNTNEIFSTFIDNMECRFVADVPALKNDKYRFNPNLLKYENNLILLPDRGSDIWIYRLEDDEFCNIKVENRNHVRIGMPKAWSIDDQIYIVSIGLRCIFRLNIDSMKLQSVFELKNSFGSVSYESILVNRKIYIISQIRNLILEYDIETETGKYYTIPQLEKGIGTICYDGEKFWLTGSERKLFSWNCITNQVNSCSNFPDNFSIYNCLEKKYYSTNDIMPLNLFSESIYIENKILFKPWNLPQIQCSGLIYMDLADHSIHTIQIAEKENGGEYSLEYIRDNRTVAVHLSPNSYISEIDMITMSIENRNIYMTDKECLRYKQIREKNDLGYISESTKEDLIYVLDTEEMRKKRGEAVLRNNVGSKVLEAIRLSK